jgi:hypothetical protein
VKPYIPYDILRFNEDIPMLKWAHADADAAVTLKCPSWIYEADIPFRTVTFSENCEAAIEEAIAARRKKKGKGSYAAAGNLEEAKLLISQVSVAPTASSYCARYSPPLTRPVYVCVTTGAAARHQRPDQPRPD